MPIMQDCRLPAWIGRGWLVGIALACAGAASGEEPPKFTLLHSFRRSAQDGRLPQGSLAAADGALFGMTSLGGAGNKGVVFRMNPDGTGYRVLRHFTGAAPDGANPDSGTLTPSGRTLYGMTHGGGAHGIGTLFRLQADGTGYANLHDFQSGPLDGACPKGSLTLADGFLYGLTSLGGAVGFGNGTLFRMQPNGAGYTNLHSFGESGDGIAPAGSLAVGGDWLYGMTLMGGAHGRGTVFRIRRDGSGYRVLRSFRGGADDGADPYGSPVVAGSVLYGMTYSGGAGHGAVFRMNTDGTGFSLLHRFAGWPSDAAHPTGDLTLDGDTLCGMALSGGARNNWRGAVFRIRTDGTGYSIVHNFAGQVHNGAGPHGSLLLQDGRLFGLASGGGQDNAGALFSLDFHPPAGPDIQANSADGVVRLAAGERVIVTVSMRPGALEGYLADWWVAARAGADWYALDPRLNWVPVSAWDQIRPVYQGALVSLWPTVILNSASLPHGDYVVYMAVDPLDGRLNPEGPIWSDAVSLAIR